MNAVLNDYILNEVSNITYDFVRSLVEKVKKNDICTYICHFFCDHVLTNNIWVLERVKSYLEKIEGCKTNEKEQLIKLIYSLLHLLGNSDKGHYTFYYPNEKSDMFQEEIKNIRYYSVFHEHDELIPLQSILTEEVYTLFNVLYESFLYSVESKEALQKCFLIIRYLLTLTPRHYIQGTTKKITTDIIDFIFLLCVWYSKNTNCNKDIQVYINNVKDIFYYKLKKKEKLIRINALFYLVFVMINKSIRYQEIDYEGRNNIIEDDIYRDDISQERNEQSSSKKNKKDKNERNTIVDDKCQYLFVYTDYDQQKLYEMEREREKNRMMSKLMRSSTKEVEIDNILMKDGYNVSITKLHN
jgi:hypothetical protein